jgi:hypothetical protein
MKFLTFSTFLGHFCPPGSGSRSETLNYEERPTARRKKRYFALADHNKEAPDLRVHNFNRTDPDSTPDQQSVITIDEPVVYMAR